MTLVPMTTERLRIRALNEDDLAAVFAIVGDHTVANGATWLQPDLESCRGYLARRIAEEAQFGYSIWGIERLDERDLIGLAGYAPRGDEIELAYSIRADQCGRGYGTEGTRAVIEAAHVRGRRVYATIRSTNVRSLAVARKIGLVDTGESIEDERGTKLIFTSP